MPKKKTSPKKGSAADDPARFEEALTELEEIVGEMEGDRVPLDELLKKYERGTSLLRLCQDQISSARARIEQIAQRAENGGVELEPFDPGLDESTKRAGSVSQKTDQPAPDDDIQLL